MPDRSVAPNHVSSFHIDFQKVQTHQLDHGVLLHALQAGTQPVIKIEVIFPAGGSYYERKPGTSLMALKMLREGTLSYTSSQLSAQFAQYGAFVDNSPSFDVASSSLYCLTRHLDKLLPYFAEMVMAPVFPVIEFKRIRQIEIEQLRIQDEKSSVIASKRFRNLLFGNANPHGRIINEQDLEEIMPDDLLSFHQKNLAHFEIIASGQVDHKTIALINSYFGKASKGISFDMLHPNADTSTDKEIRQARQHALQSSIRMGRIVIGKTHKDYIPLLIASHVLGGYFGSRLMKNIREDKGYTYGIYASLVTLKHATWFVIGTDVKKEFAEETITEIKMELKTLCTTPVGIHELDTVKNHMLGHFQSQLSSAFSLAEKFKHIYIHGLDYSYYDQFLATLESIDGKEIQSIAHQYLDPGSMKTVVIG